jgi:hypothetical protein
MVSVQVWPPSAVRQTAPRPVGVPPTTTPWSRSVKAIAETIGTAMAGGSTVGDDRPTVDVGLAITNDVAGTCAIQNVAVGAIHGRAIA